MSPADSQQDRDQVLEHHHREHQLDQRVVDRVILERARDQHRARDPDAGAGEQRLGRGPAQRACGEEADRHDRADLDHRGQAGGGADLGQLADAELEPDREHQEDHAELGQHADQRRVRDQRHRHVRADHEPREDVPEHDRQPRGLEHDGDDRRRAQDHEQLDQDVPAVHVSAASAASPSRPAPRSDRDSGGDSAGRPGTRPDGARRACSGRSAGR
jgi:hypothetical protein